MTMNMLFTVTAAAALALAATTCAQADDRAPDRDGRGSPTPASRR
jgi:predicted outer membrane protein